MKNRHQRVRDLFLLHLDEELSGRHRKRVERHLADCPDCRSRLERLREVWRDKSGRIIFPREAVWNAIAERLDSPSSLGPVRDPAVRPARRLAAAAVFAVFSAAVGAFLGRTAEAVLQAGQAAQAESRLIMARELGLDRFQVLTDENVWNRLERPAREAERE